MESQGMYIPSFDWYSCKRVFQNVSAATGPTPNPAATKFGATVSPMTYSNRQMDVTCPDICCKRSLKAHTRCAFPLTSWFKVLVTQVSSPTLLASSQTPSRNNSFVMPSASLENSALGERTSPPRLHYAEQIWYEYLFSLLFSLILSDYAIGLYCQIDLLDLKYKDGRINSS